MISLLMLVGALGGIAVSVRKLLRPASAPQRRRVTWALPYPRAVGYASVAVISLMAGALLLTQSSWISTRRVRAAQHVQAARRVRAESKTPLEPRNLDAASPRSFAVDEPQFSSAFQIGGNGVMQIGGTATDKQGNTYVAGAFYGTVTFNTGARSTTLTSTEDFDVFIAKYDPANRPLWARVANGATGLIHTDPTTGVEQHFSLDGALSLAVDAQGNAYVGGGFVKSLSFKDASGNTVATLSDSNSDINFEAFVAKYDAAGALVWARGGGSGAAADTEAEEDLDSGINGITDIVVDKAGNPYIAGAFSGANFLGRAITNNGQRDILLSRLDPATGNPVWVSTPGSARIDVAKGLAIDDNANLYLIGDVGATITFPTQPQPTTFAVDEEYGDSFVAKYDRNGQTMWAKQIAGDKPIEGVHIVATGAGDVYLTGGFASEATFDSITVADPSEYLVVSGFLAKYDTGGNAQWARIFGHYDNDGTDGFTFGYRVAVDNAGTPYVLGTFDNEVTFNVESSDAKQSLTSMGREDNFIAHYDAAGNYRWVKQLMESEKTNFNISDASVPVEAVPLRIVHNEANNSLTVTSDFLGTVALDNLRLNSGSNIQSYVATLPLSSVQFSAANYVVNKTDNSVTITVTRTGDTSGTASVNYATQDGTATQRRDYIQSFGTLSFAANETSKTFTVLLTNNNYADGDKQLNLILSNATNGLTLSAPPVAVLTIRNPNTTAPTTNPIDDTNFFVRQQYLDFLNREPDAGGFAYWTNLINGCGADASCINSRRVSVSAAFFIEQEFQQTSFFVYIVRRASLGTQPNYAQFTSDRNQIGLSSDADKTMFTQSFAQLPEFLAKYPASQNGSQFINALLANVKQSSGIDLSSKQGDTNLHNHLR